MFSTLYYYSRNFLQHYRIQYCSFGLEVDFRNEKSSAVHVPYIDGKVSASAFHRCTVHFQQSSFSINFARSLFRSTLLRRSEKACSSLGLVYTHPPPTRRFSVLLYTHPPAHPRKISQKHSTHRNTHDNTHLTPTLHPPDTHVTPSGNFSVPQKCM